MIVKRVESVMASTGRQRIARSASLCNSQSLRNSGDLKYTMES